MKVNNVRDYAYFEYPEYIGTATNTPFTLGDIVYIKPLNSIGIVLGCIDGEGEELRTDAEGMQCFCDLELAELHHFSLEGVSMGYKLKSEVEMRISEWQKDKEIIKKTLGKFFNKIFLEIFAYRQSPLPSDIKRLPTDKEKALELISEKYATKKEGKKELLEQISELLILIEGKPETFMEKVERDGLLSLLNDGLGCPIPELTYDNLMKEYLDSAVKGFGADLN